MKNGSEISLPFFMHNKTHCDLKNLYNYNKFVF